MKWSDLDTGDLLCGVWDKPALVLERDPHIHGANMFLILGDERVFSWPVMHNDDIPTFVTVCKKT